MLSAAAAVTVHAAPARAEVFELRQDGQWQQLSEQPQGPADVSGWLAASTGETSGLPPVRLAVSKAARDQGGDQPALFLNSGSASGQYAPLINAAARQYGIAPALVDAVMWQESRYNPKALSSAGAIGLMQLMPTTARHLGVDPHDPWQNVFGGAAYLRRQLDRFGNNVPLALAAYNAGPEAVAKYGGIPPYSETRGYVRTIMQRLTGSGS